VLRLDKAGLLQEVYSFKGAPVWCSENPRYAEDSASIVVMLTGNTEYTGQKLLLSLERYNQYPGDSAFTLIPSPAGGHMDVAIAGGRFVSHRLSFPAQIGTFYPRDMNHMSYALSHKQEILYCFPHTPDIFVYDPQQNICTQKRVRSTLLDTVRPLPADFSPSLTQRPRSALTEGRFMGMMYDPYRKYYLRFLRLPLPADAPPTVDARYAFMVLDTSFRVVGEGYMPDSLSTGRVLARPEGIYCWNYRQSKSPELRMTFTLLELGPAGEGENMPQATRKAPDFVFEGGGVSAYAKSAFGIGGRKTAILFVPVERICEGCAYRVIRYYIENREVLREHNVHLILTGSKGKIKAYLDFLKVPADVAAEIKMDYSLEPFRFFKDMPDQSILWIRKNREVQEFSLDQVGRILLPERMAAFLE
jgi:hypothetical protein